LNIPAYSLNISVFDAYYLASATCYVIFACDTSYLSRTVVRYVLVADRIEKKYLLFI